MQTLFKHIPILRAAQDIWVMASAKSWTLNYNEIQSVLGGDRFEPTREGARD